MLYHIKNQSGETIASFLRESDRDYCIEALQESYDYCVVFDAVNGK